MKHKLGITITSMIVIFAVLIGLCAFEFMRNNSLSEQLHKSRTSSSASEMKKLKGELSSERENNKSLSSQVNSLNEQCQSLQSQVEKIKNTKAAKNGAKTAYLTFDDGPSAYTEDLLATLRSCNVHATFFVIGTNCVRYPDALKDIAADGNAVGVHAWNHDYSTIYASVDSFTDDYKKLRNYLTDQLGTAPTVCRFPGGTNNTRCLSYGGHIMKQAISVAKSLNLKPYDWNADAGDAVSPIPLTTQVVSNVIKDARLQNSAIILCHDFGNRRSTIEAVPQIVSQLRALGYNFDVLSSNSPDWEFKPA